MTSSTAELCCDDRCVIVRYLGARRWSLDRPISWQGPHEELAGALRKALGLEGAIPYDTKRLSVSARNAQGTIKNNTFPTDRWIVDLDGPRTSIGVYSGLDQALLACLAGLRLTPAGVRGEAPSLEPFTRASLEAAAEPDVWARGLAEALTSRLRAAADPEEAASIAIAALKSLGHRLYSDGESDDFATWSYDYTRPPPGPRLVITFSYPAYEEPEVEVSV